MKRSRRAQVHLIRRGLLYSLGLCLLTLMLGGVGFWWLEPGIHSLQDGLWLAFTTAATVGYGDLVPRTAAGRAFSVLVVVLGLSVLSLVTASLAAMFVEQEVEQEERQIERDLMREIHFLRREVALLQDRLEQLAAHPNPAPHEEPS